MSNKRVQQILDQLARDANASGVSGYENDSFEAAAFEGYLVSTGMDSYTAKVTAAKAIQVPAMAAKIRQAMTLSNVGDGQGLGRILPGQPGNVLAAATFNISVKRLTAALAAPLPFVLFGNQDYTSGYRKIIGGIIPLPTGITLTSVKGGEVDGLPNSVRFEYTDGANTDIVEVSSSTYPYPSLLSSTNTDLLRLSKIREKLSNATLTEQYDNDLVTVSSSPFGKSTQNQVTPASFITPEQFQSGVVDIDAVFDVDKETGIASKIIATAAFTVNFSVYVEKFYRQITKGGF